MSIETNCLYDYKLNEKGAEAVKDTKSAFSDFQQIILGSLKPSREASIVKTKLEEASFYATRAIASHEENHSEIITY